MLITDSTKKGLVVTRLYTSAGLIGPTPSGDSGAYSPPNRVAYEMKI